jgi:rhodanese-related sulfurtransferase
MSSLEVDAEMASPTEITVQQLARLVGLPGAPAMVDLRKEEEFTFDPRLVPTAQCHSSIAVIEWWKRYGDRSIVVVCQSGGTLSQAAAARLRHEGLDAKTLEGGHEAWREARQPLVRAAKIHRVTTRDEQYG